MPNASEWSIPWSPDARDDLRAIVEFIAARGEAVNAVRIFDRIVARVDSLAIVPGRGRKVLGLQPAVEPLLHEVVERPWRILYACERGRVVIGAIMDGRRNVTTALESHFGLGYPNTR